METIAAIRDRGHQPFVLFLEARDDVLIRRFDSVRRTHPLQGDGTLQSGIAHEREEIYERPPVGHGLLAAERAQGIQEVVGRRVPVEPGSQPNRGVLQW